VLGGKRTDLYICRLETSWQEALAGQSPLERAGATFEYSKYHDMSEQINLRIPTGLLEEIDAMADAVGESRSEFLRTAAAERMGYLRREQDDEAAQEDE